MHIDAHRCTSYTYERGGLRINGAQNITHRKGICDDDSDISRMLLYTQIGSVGELLQNY